MMPRLAIMKFIIQHSVQNCKYLVDANSPSWLRRILFQCFAIDTNQIEFFDPTKERVQLIQGIIPSLTIQSRMHPINAVLFDLIALHSGAETHNTGVTKLFISRRILGDDSNTGGRSCANEGMLCQIAAEEFGYTIVAPETFPWKDQIQLFRSARMVAGLFGSALHNTIFSRAGTRVGAIGPLNAMQSEIGAIRGHYNLYLDTDPAAPARHFTVNLDRFRKFMEILSGPH
jgi:capsular polysaccharide biosynthesis protein